MNTFIMNVEHSWKMARVIALYHSNVLAMEWAETMQKQVKSEWATPYLREKLDCYALGFHYLFHSLDHNRQRIHLQLMWDRYGADAELEWAAFNG